MGAALLTAEPHVLARPAELGDPGGRRPYAWTVPPDAPEAGPAEPASRDQVSDHAERAARVYGAAADHYRLGSLAFWDRFGAATVARLPLRAGHSVLDLCCGAGASAIPAALAVGADGQVIGVDLADPLLELGRTRAAAEDLRNIEFRRADATSTGFPAASFDAVVCVFGVYFAPDMAGFTAEMWRLVKPGGVLAITTWGPGLFEPANDIFWESVRAVEPALYKAFNPWEEITTPDALTSLYERAGVERAVTEAAIGWQELSSPARFWDVVLGSGYRATIDSLGEDQQDVLREQVVSALAARDITTIRTNVVFGVATRPG
ncbi:MAG TPA: methyltransferase domain-containing protein [Streptosporangiaceae bacterium]